MPFKSQAQRAFLYANHPDVAAKFQEHTVSSRSNLPLYSGPADAQDPKGSKQDTNPFVAGQKKKGKKHSPLQGAAARRMAKLKVLKGQKGNGSN